MAIPHSLRNRLIGYNSLIPEWLLAIAAATALAAPVGTGLATVLGLPAVHHGTSTTLRLEAYIGVIMLAVVAAGRTRLRPRLLTRLVGRRRGSAPSHPERA